MNIMNTICEIVVRYIRFIIMLNYQHNLFRYSVSDFIHEISPNQCLNKFADITNNVCRKYKLRDKHLQNFLSTVKLSDNMQ